MAYYCGASLSFQSFPSLPCLFTLREVYQLTKIRTAYNALLQFCLHLTISLSSWIVFDCFQLVMKEIIYVATKEKGHSPD